MSDGEALTRYWGGLWQGRFGYSNSGDLLDHSERRFGCFKMIFVMFIAAIVVLAIIFLLRVILHV